MSEKRYVFGPLSPRLMSALPNKKKKRKKALEQREQIALNIAHTMMNLMGDGETVVVLTIFKTRLDQVKYESE